MKKLVSLLLVLALSLCGLLIASAEEDDGLYIGYMGCAPTAAFSKQLWESIEKACNDRGYKYECVFTDMDPAKMRTAYEQFKLQGVDIILDNNETVELVQPFAEQAWEEGIPFLTLTMKYPDHPEFFCFGPSNQSMGYAAGEGIGKIVAEEWGTVDLVLLVGTFVTAPAITERLTSAYEKFQEFVDCSNAEVLEIAIQSGQAATAYQLVSDALTSHPGMKTAVFCQTDDMAKAAFAGVEAQGRGDITIGYGSDCIDAALEYWQEAILTGNTKAPWRGSIYLDTDHWGDPILDMAENMLAGTQEETFVSPVIVLAGMHNWQEFWPDLLERDFTTAD